MKDGVLIKKIVDGQKLIIYSILIGLLAIALQFVNTNIGALATIVSVIMSLVGMFRLASGLGYPIALKMLLVVLLVIPLIGLVTLLILNARATKALRHNGYEIGLLGAKS